MRIPANNEYHFGWRGDAWLRSGSAVKSTRARNVNARHPIFLQQVRHDPTPVARARAGRAAPPPRLPTVETGGPRSTAPQFRAVRSDCTTRTAQDLSHRAAGRVADIFPVPVSASPVSRPAASRAGRARNT